MLPTSCASRANAVPEMGRRSRHAIVHRDSKRCRPRGPVLGGPGEANRGLDEGGADRRLPYDDGLKLLHREVIDLALGLQFTEDPAFTA